jgi:hypothetical protein
MNHKELDSQLVFSARQCCTGVGGNPNRNHGGMGVGEGGADRRCMLQAVAARKGCRT